MASTVTAALLPPLEAEDSLSLAERAYRRLRDAIARGQLAAGTKVSERGLAVQLGISAQPVREALRRLEADGMVLTTPRSGTVVAEFGPEKLAEMGRIRAGLEGAAAALAAERADDAALAAMEAQLAVMREATAAADTARLATANERFHALLHAAAGNGFLERSLTALRAYDHFNRVQALESTPQELPKALAEHEGIVAALRERDPDLAEARMRAHVLRSLRAAGLLQRNDP
jgi:DNA-binding GntR family transcriptional regulator